MHVVWALEYVTCYMLYIHFLVINLLSIEIMFVQGMYTTVMFRTVFLTDEPPAPARVFVCIFLAEVYFQ